jgi:uncharacterized protein (DUF2384 family)
MNPVPDALLKAVNDDQQLAEAIAYCIGDSWAVWLETPIPALEWQKPIRLLRTRQGRHQLRAMLQRMP